MAVAARSPPSYDAVVTKLQQMEKQENITEFYCVNMEEDMRRQVRTGQLSDPNVNTDITRFLGLSGHDKLRGPRLCLTRYKDDIPDRSPYGDRLLQIACHKVFQQIQNPVLLYETVYYCADENAERNNVYVWLHLMSTTYYENTIEKPTSSLKKLDIYDNAFLSLAKDHNSFTSVKNASGVGFLRERVWVECFIDPFLRIPKSIPFPPNPPVSSEFVMTEIENCGGRGNNREICKGVPETWTP